MTTQLSAEEMRAGVEAALAILDKLDNRLACAENGDFSIGSLRGDFDSVTTNTLRAAFSGLWRLLEAGADDDVDYSAVTNQWSHPPDVKVSGVTTANVIDTTELTANVIDVAEVWGGLACMHFARIRP